MAYAGIFPRARLQQNSTSELQPVLSNADAFFHSSLAVSLETRSSVPASGSLPSFLHPVYPVWSLPPLVRTMAPTFDEGTESCAC